MIEIWHNPRCSKSRQTLQLLTEAGHTPDVKLYLDTPPSRERLVEVIGLLGVEPIALVRTKEALFSELGLSTASSGDALLDAMASHPRLIERPVVITERGARLGRPPESVLEVL